MYFVKYKNKMLKNSIISRCMFGSDWPVCRYAKNTDYEDVLKLLQDLTSHLPEGDQKAIFHDTVVNYYDL